MSFINKNYDSIDNFSILIWRDEEEIDDVYEITNVDDAIDIVINSLNWKNPKGVFIIKK